MPRREKPAPQPVPREIEELYAQVYADPDDDSARLVLADALIERRDPRGDFITMQFGRASGRAVQNQKELKLVRTHGAKWREVYGDAIVYGEWERGFLSRCRLNPERIPANEALIPDAWSTLRVINLWTNGANYNGGGGGAAEWRQIVTAILSKPIRLWTRTLQQMPREVALKAFECPLLRRWRTIEILCGTSSALAIAKAYEICQPENMPALRRLQVNARFDNDTVHRFMSAALTANLEDLTLTEDDSVQSANATLSGTSIAKTIFDDKSTAPKPKQITLAGGAGSITINFHGERAGEIELGLVRHARILAEALRPLTGAANLKSIRIIRARDAYRAREHEQDLEYAALKEVADKLAPTRIETIP